MILDAHAHVGADPASATRLLATMDASGIARAIVLAGGVLPPAQLARQFAGAPGVDVDADNAAVLRAAIASRGRLLPFYFANPHRSADAYQTEGAAFAGLKLGPVIHGVRFDDPRTVALIAVAERFGHPVYAHCLDRPGLRVADLVALARQFPAVRFMLGHAGIGTCDFAAVDELAGVDNAWFETSGGFTSVIAAACATLGALRVVFGGEFPLQSPAAELAKIRHAGLSDTEQALVLGGSLAALLDMSHLATNAGVMCDLASPPPRSIGARTMRPDHPVLPPATFLPPATRANLAADRSLGCGNYLFHAVATSPAPDTPLVFLDRAITTAAGPVTALSLTQLRTHVERVAAGYHARGVAPRDPVGIYLTEGVGPLIHYLALTSLGAIAVQVNGAMLPEIAARYLARVGVVGLVIDAAHHAAFAAHRDPDTALRFVMIDDLDVAPAAGPLPARYPYRHADEDLVMICHSSGTTGVPKAVMFAHQQFFHGVRWRLADTAAARPERLLSALPHSHSAGVAFPMLALLAGNPVFVMSDRCGAQVAPQIAAFRPTLVVAFPETHVEISELDAAVCDLSSVRAFINTGDAAHERHIRRLIGAGAVFIDGLGSSEMGFSLFHRVHTRDAPAIRRSVGRPHPWVEVAVLDDDGTPLPPGRVGKLGVRAPTITPGYWNDSLLTVRSRLAGYWLTGDLVYRDSNGEWIHVDRVPDAITTRSGMVYSLVVEELLQDGLPDVEECSVIGIPAGAGFQALLAVVRLRRGAVDSHSLRARADELLAAAGLPALADLAIATADNIPTGPTGKVLKRELRARYADLPPGRSDVARDLREERT